MNSSPGGLWFEPSIVTSLIRPFSRLSAEMPREVATRLGGLPVNDGEERMPLREFVAWLEDATLLLHDPSLGLRALRHLERGIGGVVEFGAASAPTLADAFAFLSSHARVLNEAADFGLWVDGEYASFELRSRLRLPRALRDFQLGSILFALRKWLGDSSDCQLRFSYPEPPDSALHRSLFAPSVVCFGASCDAVVFKAQHLSEAPLSADAALHKVLRCHAERIEHVRSDDKTLTPRVRTELFELGTLGVAGLGEIARRFGMSRRTLTRRLAHEGVNFRKLLDDVRYERALRYLESTNFGLSRIAKLLGYSEATSFCRAFSRWRGETPFSYRRAFRSERSVAQAPVLLSAVEQSN
jgi:AraC-like DNA-binding protein